MSATPDSAPGTLSRATQVFIVLIALLQGLALYLIRIGTQADSSLGIGAWTLALSLPTLMVLSVQRLDDRRFWSNVAGVGAIYLLLSLWAGWSATGAPNINAAKVLLPFGASLAVASFIALPYLQCRLDSGRWRASYRALFEHGWQNALTLLLTALFVGICWGVLGLCAVLFKLIGIGLFSDLFTTRGFSHLATGVMIGLGVLIGRTQQRPVQVARQILFAIFKGLLPLVAAIALLFVVSLPFTGLDALWSTRSATLILMSLIAVMVLFVNAVYQDGDDAPPYPRWLRHVVDAALLSLPIYAALGLYALSLRIGQYGWTSERLWAVLASIVLSAYALGYAIAALRPRAGWLGDLKRVNVGVSLTILVLVVAANSWLLDPHRLGVNDQIARWHDARGDETRFDLTHLRFDSGRRGYDALKALDADPKLDPTLKAQIARALKMQSAWEFHRDDEDLGKANTVAEVLRRVHPAAGVGAPDPLWLQALVARTLDTPDCLAAGADCVLLTPDLDRDGQAEYLLCNARDWGASCFVYTHEQGAWRKVGRSYYSGPAEDLAEAMRANEIQVKPRRWSDFQLGEDGKVMELEVDHSR